MNPLLVRANARTLRRLHNSGHFFAVFETESVVGVWRSEADRDLDVAICQLDNVDLDVSPIEFAAAMHFILVEDFSIVELV